MSQSLFIAQNRRENGVLLLKKRLRFTVFTAPLLSQISLLSLTCVSQFPVIQRQLILDSTAYYTHRPLSHLHDRSKKRVVLTSNAVTTAVNVV